MDTALGGKEHGSFGEAKAGKAMNGWMMDGWMVEKRVNKVYM